MYENPFPLLLMMKALSSSLEEIKKGGFMVGQGRREGQ